MGKVEGEGVIYLDHAATSWPKPQEVTDAVVQAMLRDAANPGRGSHGMAVRASRILFDARKVLSKLFNIRNPNDIAFTSNTTMGLNMAIKGWLNPGDHVIATSVEHNAVRRPLHYLEQTIGIEVTYIEADAHGMIKLDDVRDAIQPNTTLAIVNHSSNVLGTILPLAEIGELLKSKDVKLLVDAAQSAGVLPLDVMAMGIDMLAFPGHKGLLGPQGTGGLYIAPDIEFEPLLHGGTGSKSEIPEQPLIRPDRYEAGTQNTPGVAGLKAGVQYVLSETVERIYAKEWALTQRLMGQLASIEGITLLGPALGEARTGIVSFIVDSIDPSELSFILDQHYNIAIRAGFHCSPLAHQAAGTTGTGAVRASVGAFTTNEEIDALASAMAEITKQYKL